MSTATISDRHIAGKSSDDHDAAVQCARENLPVYDRIVVVPESAESQSAGGLIIPAAARVKTWRGTVVAVGGGAVGSDGRRQKPAINVGVSVLYEQYSGQEIEFDGHDFTIIKESDVLVVVGKATSPVS